VAQTQDRKLAEFIRDHLPKLRDGLAPLQVIAFGSRMRGDALSTSDLDLVLVSPAFAPMSFLRRPLRLQRHARHVAFTLAGRDQEAARLLQDLEWTVEHGTGVNVMMTRDVGLPVCRAVHAFGAGRCADAVGRLESVRDHAHRFGGSHAQRDVLTLTLIEAALRAGRPALARHYIAERTVHKPAGGWGWRLLARAGAQDNPSKERS